jgi:hypothetical protein
MEGLVMVIGACWEGCVGTAVGWEGGEVEWGWPFVWGAMSPFTSAMVDVWWVEKL